MSKPVLGTNLRSSMRKVVVVFCAFVFLSTSLIVRVNCEEEDHSPPGPPTNLVATLVPGPPWWMNVYPESFWPNVAQSCYVHLEWTHAPNKDAHPGWELGKGQYLVEIDRGSGWECYWNFVGMGELLPPSDVRGGLDCYIPTPRAALGETFDDHRDLGFFNSTEGKVVYFRVAAVKWWNGPGPNSKIEYVWGPPSNVVEFYVGKTPTIKDIKVTGVPETNNPTTNCPSTPIDYKVKLEAKVDCPSNFEITKYSWSGDGVKPGEGNPYEYEAAPGTQGLKNVMCTITYRSVEYGWTGTDTKTKEFKLFFVKKGDDDGDDKPNWFTYWGQDGAVSNMADLKYDASSTFYGYYSPAAKKVYLTPYSADQHYDRAVVIPTTLLSPGGESFGGPGVRGIDTVAEVIPHEYYHKMISDTWISHGWQSETDSDRQGDCNDKLPDYYESTVSLTRIDNTDTYDLAGKKNAIYSTFGDEEYMAMRAGNGAKGDASKDWANPGKQTTPTDLQIPLGQLGMMSASYEGSPQEHVYLILADVEGALIAKYVPAQAEFTGDYSSVGNDTDGDGSFDFLSVSAMVNVTSGGTFRLLATVSDSSGTSATFVNRPLMLDVGLLAVSADLSGLDIRMHGADGPFNVTLELADQEGFVVDAISFSTSAYHYTDFQAAAATFSSVYADRGVDTDGDGKYNYLAVDVGVSVVKPQDYVVKAWLYDGEGKEIDGATNSSYLSGGSHVVTLSFDGLTINRHGADGPYQLMYVSIHANEVADSAFNPYNTSALSYTGFQGASAYFTGTYENRTEDVDADGLFDYLTIGANVTVTASGNYSAAGCLSDCNGTKIADASCCCSFNDSGSQEVYLTFQGLPIYQHGVDGPYTLCQLTLYDENGTIIDTVHDAYNTSAFKHTEFTNIPEFPISLILPIFVATTLVGVVVCKRTRKSARAKAKTS